MDNFSISPSQRDFYGTSIMQKPRKRGIKQRIRNTNKNFINFIHNSNVDYYSGRMTWDMRKHKLLLISKWQTIPHTIFRKKNKRYVLKYTQDVWRKKVIKLNFTHISLAVRFLGIYLYQIYIFLFLHQEFIVFSFWGMMEYMDNIMNKLRDISCSSDSLFGWKNYKNLFLMNP